MHINFEDLKQVKVGETTPAALVNKTEAEQFGAALVRKTGMTEEQALGTLFIICQKGGTSKKESPRNNLCQR